MVHWAALEEDTLKLIPLGEGILFQAQLGHVEPDAIVDVEGVEVFALVGCRDAEAQQRGRAPGPDDGQITGHVEAAVGVVKFDAIERRRLGNPQRLALLDGRVDGRLKRRAVIGDAVAARAEGCGGHVYDPRSLRLRR